jgi:hypothetical protein
VLTAVVLVSVSSQHFFHPNRAVFEAYSHK